MSIGISLGQSVVVVFDPSTVTGMQWWFKSDALALNDSDLVASWTDSGTLAKHATAAGTARPTYRTNVLNGKPCIRFNGTTNVLTIPATDLTGTSALTAFAVCSATAGATYLIVENGPNSSTDTDGFNLSRQAANGINAHHRTTVNADYTTTGTVTTTPKLIRASYDKTLASAEVTVFLNTVEAGTRPNNFDNAGAFGNQTSFIGARNATSFFLAGDIFEIMLFNRIISDGEAASISTHLQQKYALF